MTRCAVANCTFVDDPDLQTTPCSVCGQGTHHMCANTVHEDDGSSIRYCSLACLLAGRQGDPTELPFSQMPLSLDVPCSLNPPSSLDPTQVQSVAAYVKVKKISKPRKKPLKPHVVTKPKRVSTVSILRQSYVGKVLYLTGNEIDGKLSDTCSYKFHVTEINRRKLGGTQLVPCVTMTCETNPLLSIEDAPLDNFIERLDAAPFDDRRVLQMDFTADQAEQMIQKKMRKKRRIDFTGTVCTVEPQNEEETKSDETPIDPAHEYSDDEELDLPVHGFSILDSIVESRRGLDVEDAEPIDQASVIPEPLEANITLEQTQWTRCDFFDVDDDPKAFTQSTRAGGEALKASSSPISLFMFMLPHCLWEHIAHCSEMKRATLLTKNVDKDNSEKVWRKDMKYMTQPIRAQRIFAFIMVLLMNMLQPFAGGIENHWRTDNTFMRRAGHVSTVMSRDEFRAIRRCLCFYNPSALNLRDKFTKIRYIDQSHYITYYL